MRPTTRTISTTGYTDWIPVDHSLSAFNLGVQVMPSNGASVIWAVQTTTDNPFTTLIPKFTTAEDPSKPAALTGCAVAWSVAPTVPTQMFRRIGLPATIGAGVIWTFPRGLALAVSASMLIWNLATNSASTNAWWVADE